MACKWKPVEAEGGADGPQRRVSDPTRRPPVAALPGRRLAFPGLLARPLTAPAAQRRRRALRGEWLSAPKSCAGPCFYPGHRPRIREHGMRAGRVLTCAVVMSRVLGVAELLLLSKLPSCWFLVWQTVTIQPPKTAPGRVTQTDEAASLGELVMIFSERNRCVILS